MKRHIAIASLLFIASSAMAQEHHETNEHELYVVAKGLFTTGEKITEEKEGSEIILDGASGGGFGIDLGYTLGYHFAVELDTSLSQNKVQVSKPGEEVKETAKYWTYAMDLVYTYPLNHTFGLMAKAGYEFEHETLGDEHVSDNGFVYGAGLEYHVSHHYEALLEYEGSMIDSARGSSVYAGVKYIF